MARIPVKNIDGLTLALDPKKLDRVVTLQGRNFLLDVDGPRSAFGTSIAHRSMNASAVTASFEVGSEIFYFAHDEFSSVCSVYKASWISRDTEPLFQIDKLAGTPDKRLHHPWSHALVGGLHYFCHPAFGIWNYDLVSKEWVNQTSTIHANIGSPLVLYAITAAAGRLCLQVTGFSWWSAIDDGTDVTPSLDTGAGFQNLALIGSPIEDNEYKGIFPLADGFLTVVASGVMRSTVINSINPFRHDPFKEAYSPFNQACVVSLSANELLFFTQSGFFITDGRQFQPWQPLMSEYMKAAYSRRLSQNTIGQVALFFDRRKQWVMLSFAQSSVVNLFSKAFVLYLPRDQWGSFDKTHRGLLAIDEFGDNTKISLGYTTQTGKIALFADTTSDFALEPLEMQDVSGIQNEVMYLDGLRQPEIFDLDGVTIAGSRFRMDANNYFHDYMRIQRGAEWPNSAGWYETWGVVREDREVFGTDYPAYATTDETELASTVNAAMEIAPAGFVVYGLIRQQPQEAALNANVEVGLFRLTDGDNNQQITNLTDMSISMLNAVGGETETEDLMFDYTDDITEDLMLLPNSEEDMGLGIQSGSIFTHEMIGTLDGIRTWQQQSKVWKLREQNGTTGFYVGDIQGLYCKLKIKAETPGHSFHLKDLEFDGTLAGEI